MIQPWDGDHRVWEKRRPKTYNRPMLSRSRRPLVIAICTVLLFLWWHHSTSSSVERTFLQQEPDSQRPGRRSTPGQEQVFIQEVETDDTPLTVDDARLAYDEDKGRQPILEDVLEDNTENTQLHRVQPGVNQPSEHLNDLHDTGNVAEAPPLVNGAGHESVEHNHEDATDEDVEDEVTPIKFQEQAVKGAVIEQQEQQQPVTPNLVSGVEKGSVILHEDLPKQEKILEAEPDDHLSLEEKGESLPELVHRTFEEVTKDVTLEGWEDEWVSHASFNPKTWGKLREPKIDFVYLWVNGSEEAFQETKRPFELNSVLNDKEGKWLNSHGTNRYRDWDELRYSLRSIEKHARSFRNKIQILVNSVRGTKIGKQTPTWLNDDPSTKDVVQVLSQEEFFDSEKHVCLPTFNSLTIENQIFNTPSNTDQLFALSDDMLLGRQHAASDIYSPLFGPVMGFKTNSYSTTSPPSDVDAHRFGEKPFLIYTSWLLNRRFGIRKRKGQGHFGHSLSRSVTREAIGSFPGPELQSACKRFRGEPGFQLYSWYAAFHYTIERHREALLWSYLMLRSDHDGDENLSWPERQAIMQDLEAGMKNEGVSFYRKRNFYHVAQMLERAGLEAPKVNTDVQWTSLDGPSTIQGIDCLEFDVNECLAPGFSTPVSDETSRNPIFSTALILDRVARQNPKCGDCLIKLVLNQVTRGLSPLLPHASSQAKERETVVKAVMRYRYTIINPDALFVMVTDAEQIDSTLISRYIRGGKDLAGQLCLNDDVTTEDNQELADVQQVMTELYQGLFPEKSSFEL